MVFEEIYDEVLKKNEEFGKKNRPDGPKERYSPTDMGGCKRKLALQFFDAPKDEVTEDDNKGRRVLKMGNVIHNELQTILRQSFKELKSEMYFRVPLNKENQDITFSGYVDSLAFIPPFGIVALEYKSINGFAFKYIQDEAKPEHISQLNMYLHYFGIDKGLLIYYNKNDSTIKEHKIKYDKELAERDINFVIDVQRNYIDKCKIPEIEKGYTKSTYPCSYCKFKEICFGGKEWDSEHFKALREKLDKDNKVVDFEISEKDKEELIKMEKELAKYGDDEEFDVTFPDDLDMNNYDPRDSFK